jgi:signal transduction histidine kinase
VLNKFKNDILQNSRLSKQGFWLYSPISILGYPVSILVADVNANPLLSLFAGLLLTVVTYFIYLIQLEIVIRTPFGNHNNLKLFFMVPISTGVFRGFLFYLIANLLGQSQPSGLLNRVLSSTFTTLFWLSLSNYVIAISKSFRYQYQRALHQYLLGTRGGSSLVQLSEGNKEILDNLQARLSLSVQKFLTADDPAAFRSLSGVLTQQINDQIRPLSKRIFVRSLSEFPIVHHQQLLKDALRSLEFSWVWFYFIITILAAFSNVSIRTPAESFWRTLTFLIPLSLISLVFNLLRGRILHSKLILSLSFLFAVGVLPVAVSEYLVHQIGYSGNWLATFTISPVAPAVIYVLALLKLAKQDRQVIIDALEKSSLASNTILDSEKSIERASIATYLHNTLQSELLALSRQLEVAANENNPQRSAELLEQVSTRVNRSIASDYELFAQSPLDRLGRVVESWRGILDISVDFPEALRESNRRNSIIVQAIEEVATNISRYDVASKLSVNVSKKEQGLLITFQSNGQGKLIKSKGGGTAWLNQVAISEWSITKNEIGTLLAVEI